MATSADSNLVKYVFWVKNYTPMVNKKIKHITIHHQAGSATPQQLANMFNGSRQASSNYGIANDGTISQMVKEKDRAWTSGGSPSSVTKYPNQGGQNDAESITIEVANEKFAPEWTISAKAYESLIALCADICTRYGLTPSYDGTRDKTFTTHQMFAATACPGPYILNKMNDIVQDVAKRMGTTPEPVQKGVVYKVQLGAFTKKANATRLCNKLKKEGFDAFVVEEGGMYKVQTGAFTDRNNAISLWSKLKELGYTDAWIKEVEV